MSKNTSAHAAPQPHVLYPRDLLDRFRISHSTRWHWERKGILPPRDFPSRGRPMGWLRSTIEAWESESHVASEPERGAA